MDGILQEGPIVLDVVLLFGGEHEVVSQIDLKKVFIRTIADNDLHYGAFTVSFFQGKKN